MQASPPAEIVHEAESGEEPTAADVGCLPWHTLVGMGILYR